MASSIGGFDFGGWDLVLTHVSLNFKLMTKSEMTQTEGNTRRKERNERALLSFSTLVNNHFQP